jgi:hypothetical protein
MCGGTLIQPIAMEVCAFVNIINVINHAKFRDSTLRGLVYVKGRIEAFPIGS